ncbi:MAG TPA: NAD(P)(+) transhydrogenase (Re/Si-specific) subunit beta [Terriglobales bacterium]|jgi:NAD(P) transhydrogenase subunit beta|nr:NAD(P)(+) transhydrogenase (Re/Si-specific) subunit beta [Terriglobales bacterium]
MTTILGSQVFIGFIYLVASALFILALKWMNAPPTARRGILAGEVGMVLAIGGTILQLGGEGRLEHIAINYTWIFIALGIGAAIGVPLGLVQMTAVPQRTALSHAFGAFCVTLVGTAEYYLGVHGNGIPGFKMAILSCEVILGGLTVTGSLMAAGKLQEVLPQRPITYKGQNVVNLGLLVVAIGIAAYLVHNPMAPHLFLIMVAIAVVFGVMLVIPIGGADMPTVISLLNSYAGLSAAAMGFVLNNKLLIIAGALDGSSGFILSVIMSKAMNRSFTNVLFGAFGQVQTSAAAAQEQRPVKSASPEEAAGILAAASRVVVVPGYGMAVAQAQHKVRELYDALSKRGIDVEFAIHPVAGRMPGHMNVLLAEADVPYDHLKEMDDINGDFPQVDVSLIIGANDVTNPAAKTDKASPIYGMPVLDVEKSHTVMVIKRSMNPGFAGIDNPLYYMDQTLMLFGDAKVFVSNIVKELTGGH